MRPKIIPATVRKDQRTSCGISLSCNKLVKKQRHHSQSFTKSLCIQRKVIKSKIRFEQKKSKINKNCVSGSKRKILSLQVLRFGYRSSSATYRWSSEHLPPPPQCWRWPTPMQKLDHKCEESCFNVSTAAHSVYTTSPTYPPMKRDTKIS